MIEVFYVEQLGRNLALHEVGGSSLGKTVNLLPGDTYGKIRYDQLAPFNEREVEVDAEAGAFRKVK